MIVHWCLANWFQPGKQLWAEEVQVSPPLVAMRSHKHLDMASVLKTLIPWHEWFQHWEASEVYPSILPSWYPCHNKGMKYVNDQFPRRVLSCSGWASILKSLSFDPIHKKPLTKKTYRHWHTTHRGGICCLLLSMYMRSSLAHSSCVMGQKKHATKRPILKNPWSLATTFFF